MCKKWIFGLLIEPMKEKVTVNRISTGVCKLLVLVFLLYITWIKEIFGNIAILLYGTAILLTAIVVIKCINRRMPLNGMPGILVAFFAFAAYSFVTGLFTAKSISLLISSLVTFTAFSVVCFDIWVISEEEGSIDWVLRILEICAVVCAAQVIFRGEDYRNGILVRSMTSTTNPNVLGQVMLCGLVSVVATELRDLRKRFFPRMVLVLVFSYAIILSGSRKSFLAAVLLIALWVGAFLKTADRQSTAKDLKIAAILLAGAIVVIVFLCRYMPSTAIFARMQSMFRLRADQARIQMYKEAAAFWKTSPIFGIGFNQFRLRSVYGTYSHSSYAEILACGGIVGVLIFFLPFVRAGRKLLQFRRLKNADRETKYTWLMCITVLAMELFLGLGQIFVYDMPHLLLLTLVFYKEERLEIHEAD